MPIIAPRFIGSYTAFADLPNATTLEERTLAWVREVTTNVGPSFYWVVSSAWQKVSFGDVLGGSDTGSFDLALSSATGTPAADTATAKDSYHLPFAWTTTGLRAGCRTAPGAGGMTVVWKTGVTTIGTVTIPSGSLTAATTTISDTAQAAGALIDVYTTVVNGTPTGVKASQIGKIDVNA